MGACAPRKLKYYGATGKKPVAPQVRSVAALVELIDKEGNNRIALDDALERLGQQRRARQLTDLAAGQGRFGQGNRVGHDQFVERAPAALVEDIRAKHAKSQDKLANIEQSIKALG